jgi:membrane associated rhomboid family serine protease
MGSQVVSIAWQAHMGGYIAGLFLAGLFDLWRRPGSTELLLEP